MRLATDGSRWTKSRAASESRPETRLVELLGQPLRCIVVGPIDRLLDDLDDRSERGVSLVGRTAGVRRRDIAEPLPQLLQESGLPDANKKDDAHHDTGDDRARPVNQGGAKA